MPLTTPILGLPYPEGPDAPDIPGDIGGLAVALDGLGLTRDSVANTFTAAQVFQRQVTITNQPSGDTRTFMVGRLLGNPGAGGVNDGCFDHDTDQWLVRKSVAGEISDSPHYLLRRAGPNGGAAYNDPMQQILDGQPLGYLGWQEHDGTAQDKSGWTGGTPTANGFPCQIYTRAKGNATKTNRGGDFYIATTKQDELTCVPRERVTVKDSGKVTIAAPTDSAGAVAPAKDTLNLVGGNNTGITFNGVNMYAPDSSTAKTDFALHVGTTFRHLGTLLGFHGVAAVAQASDVGAAAFTGSDTVSRAALETWANAIRTMLRNVGLMA